MHVNIHIMQQNYTQICVLRRIIFALSSAGSLSPELWSGVGALAVMVVVVVCAFVCGMVLFLKLRKQRTGASQYNFSSIQLYDDC